MAEKGSSVSRCSDFVPFHLHSPLYWSSFHFSLFTIIGNGRFFGTFALKSENLANLHGLKVKNGFNLDTNVGAQNLHLLLTEFADF